jgi:hypothetical protein
MPNQISIRPDTYARLVKGLPRNANGRIRPGAIRERLDALINAALDKEQK